MGDETGTQTYGFSFSGKKAKAKVTWVGVEFVACRGPIAYDRHQSASSVLVRMF